MFKEGSIVRSNICTRMSGVISTYFPSDNTAYVELTGSHKGKIYVCLDYWSLVK